MKKLLAGLLISISVFIFQCDKLPQSTLDEAKKSVKIAIAVPAHFTSVACRATATVSAYNMDTITSELSVTDSCITGIIYNIPAGAFRFFEVNVYGYDSSLLYYGNTYADVYPGKSTYVNLVLKKPNGTALIFGYIEEDSLPSETLSLSTPYIREYYHGLPSGVDSIVFETQCNPDIPNLNISWIIDSSLVTQRNSKVFSYRFKSYGVHSVRVSTFYGGQTISSEPFYFTVTGSDTSVIDTIPEDSTIHHMYDVPADCSYYPPVITLNKGDTVVISASGSWSMDSTRGNSWTGPQGSARSKKDALYPNFALGALLGSIVSDNDTTTFLIGEKYTNTSTEAGQFIFLPNRYINSKQGKEAGSMGVVVAVYRFRP